MTDEKGITIGGRKISYKVLVIGGAGALALYVLTRGSGGNSGTLFTPGSSAPTQTITTQIPVPPDLSNIQNALNQLTDEYNQLIQNKPATVVYKVQANDTLASIAQRFGITGRDIIHFNAWLQGQRQKFNAGGFVGRYIVLPNVK